LVFEVLYVHTVLLNSDESGFTLLRISLNYLTVETA